MTWKYQGRIYSLETPGIPLRELADERLKKGVLQDPHGLPPRAVVLQAEPLTWMIGTKTYTLGMVPAPSLRLWSAKKKEPKMVGIPDGYEESFLAKDKPKPLDGQSLAAWKALHAIDKRLCKANTVVKLKVSKRPKRERRVLSPALCSHMKSLCTLPPAPQGVRLVRVDLFTKLKGVIEQEKVIMPSTHTCTIGTKGWQTSHDRKYSLSSSSGMSSETNDYYHAAGSEKDAASFG